MTPIYENMTLLIPECVDSQILSPPEGNAKRRKAWSKFVHIFRIPNGQTMMFDKRGFRNPTYIANRSHTHLGLQLLSHLIQKNPNSIESDWTLTSQRMVVSFGIRWPSALCPCTIRISSEVTIRMPSTYQPRAQNYPKHNLWAANLINRDICWWI